MDVGISTAAYYGALETEDAAARLSALGVDCCEVFLETYSEYTGGFGQVVRKKLGGVRAVSVHSKTQHFETDFIGRSPRQRQDAHAMFGGLLDAAHALGAGVYVYHGPANAGRGTPDFARWREGMAAAISQAAERGVRFCWETVSWCWLNTPTRVGEFLALWPDLSFVLDIKQVAQLGQDPQAYIDAMGDRLCHVHVLDQDAMGRQCLPGQGVFDFAALARALRDVGCRGAVILEPYAQTQEDEPALREALSFLRDVFH